MNIGDGIIFNVDFIRGPREGGRDNLRIKIPIIDTRMVLGQDVLGTGLVGTPTNGLRH